MPDFSAAHSSPPSREPAPQSQPLSHSSLDPSMHSLLNGGHGSPGRAPTKSKLEIDDRQWKFRLWLAVGGEGMGMACLLRL